MLSSLAVETLPKLRFPVSKREIESEEGEQDEKVQGSGTLQMRFKALVPYTQRYCFSS